MAVIYICKQCNGSGRVERKLWFVTASLSCRSCEGEGKRKSSKRKVIN